MTMVEHIASVIQRRSERWTLPLSIQEAEELARTVIWAIREPSGEMKDAGAFTFDGNLTGQPTRCWQAMIDQALK